MRGTLTLFRSDRLFRAALPCTLAAIMAFGPIAAVNAARHGKTTVPATPLVPGIRTIALFAATNQAGTGGDVAASAYDASLKMRLNASGAYQATSFTTRLPAVQRAITESSGGSGALTSADIKTPITDSGSARRIAEVMATDGYILDEVDAYKEDPSTHTVTVTVSGSLYSTATGAAVRTFAVSGVSAPEIAGEDDSAITERASASAASQIVSTFGVISREEKSSQLPDSSSGRHSAAGSILLIALAGLLIGVVASNLNGHGHTVNGSGSGNSSSSTTGGTTGTTTSTTGPPAPPST